jgi:HK97 family phage major capsid protein
MSEEIKNLNESVQTLITEMRSRMESGLADVVDKNTVENIKTELKSEMAELRTAVAAANTPSVEATIEENIDRAKEAFGAYLTSGDRAGVRTGSELKVKDLSLNVAQEGGVFLPKVFSGVMTDLLRKKSAIRRYARVISSGQNFVHPVKTAQGSAGLRAEKGAIAASSTQAFNLMTFVPQEINARQSATAWAHDGDAQVALVNMLMEDIAGAIGEKEGDFFLNGTNANTLSVTVTGAVTQTGLLTGKRELAADRFSNKVGSLFGIETATKDAITYDDVAKLRSTLHGNYLSNAKYIMDAATELDLITLKDGNDRYLITNGDVVNGIPGRIWGNEYIVEDNMPSAIGGTGARMVLADLSKYFIVDHSGFRWIANPLADYTMVEYFAGRRTAGGNTDAQAVRALFNKAA